MGSSGSGRFSDYSNREKKEVEGGGGSSGGSSGVDRCGQAFGVSLEDVADHDFYVTNQNVPDIGVELSIELQSRVVAVDDQGVVVGALPTKFNYLAACLESGFRYAGRVRLSGASLAPYVTVDFVVV